MRDLWIFVVLAAGCSNEVPAVPAVPAPPAPAPVVLIPSSRPAGGDSRVMVPEDAFSRRLRDARSRMPVLLNPERADLALSPGDRIEGRGSSALTLVEGGAPETPFDRVVVPIADARLEVLFFDVRDVGHVVVALRPVRGGRLVYGMLVDPIGRGARPRTVRREQRGSLAVLSWSFSAGRSDGAQRMIEMGFDDERAWLVRAETVRGHDHTLPEPPFHAFGP